MMALAAPAAAAQAGASVGNGQPTAPAARPIAAPTRLSDAALAPLFRMEPGYPRASVARLAVVGAFQLAEPPGTHLVRAWSMGFLPVTLQFSDGRCLLLSADYNDSTLSNGMVRPTGCAGPFGQDPAPPKPNGRSLRFVGASWGYAAWADDAAGVTLLGRTDHGFQAFASTRLPVTAMVAMNGVDSAGGNITLVGRIGGRLTIVTLDVAY